MSETNTVTCSTAPHMIQELPLHQGNPQHQKNKKKNKKICTPKLPTNSNANPTSWAGGAVNNKSDVEFTTPPAPKLARHQSPPGAPAP